MSAPLKILFFICFLAVSVAARAQVQPPVQKKDTLREFEILNAKSLRSIKVDSVTTLQTVAGDAVIKQGGTVFYADSAVLNSYTHQIEAFGNIHINQGDSVHTYGQYLKYLGVEKIAYLKRNVKLTDGKGTLTTQDLDYNLETGIGNFYNGGRVVEGKNVITSVNGTYYADTKDVYFKKNVVVDGPKNHIKADSLLYNMQTKISSFISQTQIKNEDVNISTSEGTYDLNTGNALFTARTTVKDSTGRIYSADNMALEDKSGNAQLEGNAVIIDTANNFVVLANQIFLNKNNNSFLATRKPLLIVKQKNDSTFIAADTIFSGVKRDELTLKDTMVNNEAGENIRIEGLLSDTSMRILNVDSLPDAMDSAFSPIQPDSLQKDTSVLKDTVLLRPRDSLPDIGKKVPPDTGIPLRPQTDSSQNPIDTIPIDSLIRKPPVSSVADTAAVDAVKTAPGITDSTRADSTVRYFLAFHNVRIFNDSLQSVSDSLYFSTKDSVFRLYKDPVIWSGNTQINGDTIYLFTKNKEPERLYVFEKGLIVNRTREGFFNQMGGKTINGYFINGKIDYLRVRGSQSESVYYMQDEDSAYIGMNRSTGDVIDLYFRNDDLWKVKFVNEVKGHMYPMSEIPEGERELRNFQWLDARRPKSKFELYE